MATAFAFLQSWTIRSCYQECKVAHGPEGHANTVTVDWHLARMSGVVFGYDEPECRGTGSTLTITKIRLADREDAQG